MQGLVSTTAELFLEDVLLLRALNKIGRVISPVITSDKEGKHAILPTTLNFAARRGKLRIYTLQKPPEVF